MILERIRNAASLRWSGEAEEGAASQQPGQASQPPAAHQRGLFLMYLLFMFSIFPAGKHMLSFKLGKLRRHVKTT